MLSWSNQGLNGAFIREEAPGLAQFQEDIQESNSTGDTSCSAFGNVMRRDHMKWHRHVCVFTIKDALTVHVVQKNAERPISRCI